MSDDELRRRLGYNAQQWAAIKRLPLVRSEEELRDVADELDEGDAACLSPWLDCVSEYLAEVGDG